ncbi:uncharacterized protein LOC118755016 [Rhagoletis pomonella]|uniref:uncharacterized protein LOC118755016 n=1 Tax=Rhagoletis pomonella TaxID=28610 RepID=UPI0017838495|nr:uncharacterized protein LOC118755016 [Rhagoletis pomonella]
MASSILASREKLKGRENYSSWKFSMQNYLALEDLDGCLTGVEASEKKNAKAKAAIALSVDKVVFVHIQSASSAKEIWENLQSTFEDKGAIRRVTLTRKIVNTKLDSCESMDVYVSEIISTAQKLNEVGFEVPDEWLAIFLLSGLTDDYMPMIMAMEGSDKKLSSDNVKTKLVQESTRASTTGEKAFFTRKANSFRKRSGIVCYTCRQKGHKFVDCANKSKKNVNKNFQKTTKSDKGPVAFSAVFLSGNFDKGDWYIDSAATRNMIMRSDWVVGLKKFG